MLFSQQDSQEFLRYLLQGLHEDVNRVITKPKYIGCDEEAEEKLRLVPLRRDKDQMFDLTLDHAIADFRFDI